MESSETNSHPPGVSAAESEEFADLTVRFLDGRPERRERARADLRGRLHLAASYYPEEFKKGLGRLRKGRDLSKAARLALRIGIAFVVAIILLELFDLEVEGEMSRSRVKFHLPFAEEVANRRTKELEIAQPPFRLRGLEVAEMGELSRKEPDDPVWYQAWIRLRIKAGVGLPKDYDQHWQKIDPDNGIWLDLKAQELASRVHIEGRRDTGEIENLEVFAKMVEAMKEALKHPFWRDYSRRLQDRQRAAFRPPQSIAEDDATSSKVWAAKLPAMDPLQRPIQTACGHMIAIGNTVGAAELMDLWADIARLRLLQPGNELATEPMDLRNGAEDLCRGAMKAGLNEPGSRLAEIAQRGYTPRGFTVTHETKFLPAAAIGIACADVEEAKPRRMAEYAQADRAAVIVIAAAAIVFAGALNLLVSAGAFGALAKGLRPLFTAADDWRLVLFGVLFPVAWWLAVIHLTPAGTRDVGIEFYSDSRLIWKMQEAAGLLLVLIATQSLVKRQIAKGAAYLAVARRTAFIDWIAISLVALAPFPLWANHIGLIDFQGSMLVTASMLGVPLLWLLWQGAMGCAALLRSRMQASLLLPRFLMPLVALTLICLASVPLMRYQERQWLKNDIFDTVNPPGVWFWYRLEDQSAEYARSHLR